MDFDFNGSSGGVSTTRSLHFGQNPIPQQSLPLVSCINGVAVYGANEPQTYNGQVCPTAGNPTGQITQTFNPFERTPVITISPIGTTNMQIQVTHRVLIKTECTGVCGQSTFTTHVVNSFQILSISGLVFKQVGVTSTFRWRNPVTLTGIRFSNWNAQTFQSCAVSEAPRPAYSTTINMDWNPQYFIATATNVAWTGSGSPVTFTLQPSWTVRGGAQPFCEWEEITSDGIYTFTMKITLTAQQEHQVVVEITKAGLGGKWTSQTIVVPDVYDGAQYTIPGSGVNSSAGSVTFRAIRI